MPSFSILTAFASLPDHNLILVDWSFYNGNKFPIAEVIDIIFAYISATLKLHTTGETLAQFFDFLKTHKQIDFSDITILSHSLGCHGKTFNNF